MKAVAAARFDDPLTTEIPYIATTFAPRGMATPVTDRPAARTSVAYTTAASASPADTAPSVALASAPRVTMPSGRSTPARASSVAAYEPHGAERPHSATVPRRGRSARPRTPSGLPGFTAICIALRAKILGAATTLPDRTSRSCDARSAEAKTSAGAPASICATSAEVEPKFVRTRTPGFAMRNAATRSVNASVSDDAADTVIDPFGVAAGPGRTSAAVGEAGTRRSATDATPARASAARADIFIVSMRLNGLSLLDQIVLSLVDEEPRHGFGVAAAISGDEALSMAITVHRPLVYRAIERLHDEGLLAPARTEPGRRGAPRTVWRTTAAGRSAATEWLQSTVPHPRDARLELLAKFALRSRRGMANRRFAAAQRRCFEPVAASLRSPDSRGAAADLVRRWRYESVAAMIRLLRDLERTG